MMICTTRIRSKWLSKDQISGKMFRTSNILLNFPKSVRYLKDSGKDVDFFISTFFIAAIGS